MNELFPSPESSPPDAAPLAARMRPRTLDEFVGQEHILGKGKLLRKMIEADRLASLIFYGPAGCGKTALAMVIARTTKKAFCHLNAVTATVADVREVITMARDRLRREGRQTILFLDEIAHFNKLQQDALMPDVEEGVIVLIGATTHNPYFAVNSPLLSRAHIFEFTPLSDDDVARIVRQALEDRERGLGLSGVRVEQDALVHIVRASEGDGRRALNALECAVLVARERGGGERAVDLAAAEEAVQRKRVVYDRDEDSHYDTISAFIKSMRGSDPDAALYYLARMIVAGEDPRFIARRIVICASEDVGNADPQALLVADAAFRAVEVIGMPEARIILAQAVVYVATAPKSNASYLAVEKALGYVQKEKSQPVPRHLQDAHYPGAKKLGRGAGYRYPHDFPGHYVPQEYMPRKVSFYAPSDQGYERRIFFFLRHLERLAREYEKRPQAPSAGREKPPRQG